MNRTVSSFVQGILGCDLVGFHIEDYCINFIDCCQRGLGCRVDKVGSSLGPLVSLFSLLVSPPSSLGHWPQSLLSSTPFS